MDYVDIKLSIYEKALNGEIDDIEKEILLERLEEKHNEENDTITLEEAMDVISSYLSESTAQARKSAEYWKEMDRNVHKSNKLVKLKETFEQEKNEKMVKAINDKLEKLEKERKDIFRKIQIIDPESAALRSHEMGRITAHTINLTGRPVDAKIERVLKRAKEESEKNPWRGNSERKEREPGAYKTTKGLKESVDDLRLQVYEACKSGIITDDEKKTFLEYLNIENYE